MALRFLVLLLPAVVAGFHPPSFLRSRLLDVQAAPPHRTLTRCAFHCALSSRLPESSTSPNPSPPFCVQPLWSLPPPSQIPARDGTLLNTIIFLPWTLDSAKKFDTVLIRTPYNAQGLKSEGETYVAQGFAVAMQDFRGRYGSKGQFACWFNASTGGCVSPFNRCFNDAKLLNLLARFPSDGHATVEYIVQQDWSSGHIMTTGVSANALASYFEELAWPDPNQVRAQFNVVGSAELHKTIFQGGAYRQSLMGGWLAAIGESGFEGNFTQHEGMSAFYDNVSMSGKWSRVTAPAVHLTGW